MASRPKQSYTSAEMAKLILADNDDNSDNFSWSSNSSYRDSDESLNKVLFLLLTLMNHAVTFLAVKLNQMKIATLTLFLMELIMQQKSLLLNGENIHHLEQAHQKHEILSRNWDQKTTFQHPLHIQKTLLI